MLTLLSALVVSCSLSFASPQAFEPVEDPVRIPPALTLAAGPSGLLTGTIDFTTNPPQIIASLSGSVTGVVKLQLLANGQATVTASTSLGNSLFGRGYWSGAQAAGSALGVCLYSFPATPGQRHLFELKWVGSTLSGGWCLY